MPRRPQCHLVPTGRWFPHHSIRSHCGSPPFLAAYSPEEHASKVTKGSGHGRLLTAARSPPRLAFLPLLVVVAEGDAVGGGALVVGQRARLRSPVPTEAAWLPSGANAMARTGVWTRRGCEEACISSGISTTSHKDWLPQASCWLKKTSALLVFGHAVAGYGHMLATALKLRQPILMADT
eukprot:1159357-Pelagomonas_calceolata.AAC.13